MTAPPDPGRILLVDDLPSIHEDFRKILAPAAAGDEDLAAMEAALFGAAAPPPSPRLEVASAFQGQQALAMAEAALAAGRPYALAFVDMRMPPGWDGVETIERLWRVDPRLQVVICTAFTDRTWADISARLGVGDRLLVLKKPFEAIEVQQLANALTRKWSLARQAESYVGHLEADVERRTRELSIANSDLRAEIVLRREVERALRVYAEVIRSTGEAVAITDLAGEIIEVNPAYQDAVGRTRDELVGTPVFGLDAASHQAREIRAALEHDGRWRGEVLDRRRNGELFPSLVQINAVQGEDGACSRYVCVSRDITAAKQSEQQLQRMACYDALTELPNRALFLDRLHVALAESERHGGSLALMCIDLDHFKDVNDSLGHPAGDRLLVEVGRRISSCVRSADTVARMGGDEFMVLLTRLNDPTGADDVARRLVELLREPVQLDEHNVHVGASVGISVYPQHGRDAAELQKHADTAMYEAKHGGRGQFRVYTEQMSARSGARLQLAAAIEAALEEDGFTLVFQPIVCAETGSTDHVEALIRWTGPDGKPVSPGVFIPYAEECGLIRRIDAWVLERACSAAAAWRAAGRRSGVCVNLSALTVQHGDLAALVAAALQKSGLEPQGLTIEITETAVVRDPFAARRALEAVMALGVSVSVDDFGTGYASLSYLTMFPISCIKLDRCFVERIGNDPASEEVIRSMLDLARRLRLDVVAEGIERAEQQQFLGQAGCGRLQGFLLARPMSIEQLQDWLDRTSDTEAARPGASREPQGAAPVQSFAATSGGSAAS